MAASHIQKFKVSIITLTGRDDDVLYYEGSASVSSINISISFTLLNKSLGFVTYQLSFLHALVGFVQLRKALIQKQYCIYRYLIVWILRLLWHENEFCYTWRKNNGMSSFNFCNCSLSVSAILDICLGGCRGWLVSTLVLVKFWRSMQLKYSCYS